MKSPEETNLNNLNNINTKELVMDAFKTVQSNKKTKRRFISLKLVISNLI
jgi:hypothetical protein